MATYERFNGRVDNNVKLRRNFFNDGILYDPYKIDKIEIWKTRFDLEYEAENPGSLLMDTLYGSRMILLGLNNSAYGILGLEAGQAVPDIVTLTEYEEDFINTADITFPHNLNDLTPIVTVYDTTSTTIIPDGIQAIDANNIRVTFSSATSGTVDIVGAVPISQAAPASLVKKYTQAFVNQTLVQVNHNTNDDFPNVVIYDFNYNQIFPDAIRIIDADNLEVIFGIAQSGTIVVIGGNVGYAVRGFGEQCVIYGTKAENFDIHTAENDTLLISVDSGTDQTIVLPQDYNAQANDIITSINSTLVGATAQLHDGNKIKLVSDSYGAGASIELKTIANSAYTTIGIVQGLDTGLGYPPAETAGTRSGTFTITNTSKWLRINIDSLGDIDIDLLEGGSATRNLNANQIASIMTEALALTSAIVTVSANRSITITAPFSIQISAIPLDAYTQLGFTVGPYGPTYTGSGVETFPISSINNRLRILNNYQPAVDVILTYGNLSIDDIVNQINAVFTANSIEAIAEETLGATGGRLSLRSLTNNGIIRIGVGQYYCDYLIPTTFLSDGVYNLQYLDVWYYAPIQLWEADVADDTSNFTVYADNYFLDTGFSNYDFAFTLMKDTYWKGEKRPMITKVVALPKYATPTVNEWILPLSNAEYQIITDENSSVQPWTATAVNSGTEIRVNLDTTNALYREGLYKMQLRLNLPDGEVILSPNLKFRITNK